MAENDSDGINDLLEDIDDLDEQLFGRNKKLRNTQPSKSEGTTTENKKNHKSGDFLSNLLSEREISKKTLGEHPVGGAHNSSPLPQSVQKKTTMDGFLEPVIRNVDMNGSRVAKTDTSTNLQQNPSSNVVVPSRSNFLSFLPVDDTSKRTNAEIPLDKDTSSQIYDRSRRLENEIDRLNREIDEIKITKKRDEEEVVNEWKQKLNKKQIEFNETLETTIESYRKQIERLKEEHAKDLSDLRDTFARQLEALQVVQQQTKNSNDVLQEVKVLTDHISEISTKVSSQSERNAIEQEAKLTERERLLQFKEERLAKDEERLMEERKTVDELNLKLKSLCEDKEAMLLKEKWQIREEKNKLNAEKKAFKEDQKLVLDILEKQKAEIEHSRTKFLSEQQDLLVRVINEKSQLDEERSAFLTQRNSDITRIKDEAQKLDSKLIEIENAERLLTEAKRMYEIKYRMLIELEQTLTDECNELDECRKQIEAARMYQISLQQLPFWNEDVTNINVEKPILEEVADPYISTKPTTRCDNAKALLNLHSQQAGDFKMGQINE